jgi:DNA-directed RNA polymerase specialized sigma24 family protein
MAQKRRGAEATGDSKAKKKPLCRQLSPEYKTKLFNQYVMPHERDVYTLSLRYTNKYQDVESNFNLCLSKLWDYIGSYNPARSIDTWIHIVVKRCCFNQNKKQQEEQSHLTDVEMVSMHDLHQHGTSNVVDASFGGVLENVSEPMYKALMQIPPHRLSPFLLWVQGYGIREIANMEYKNGHMEVRSEEKVRSRIYWTQKQLKFILKKHGVTRTHFTTEQDD